MDHVTVLPNIDVKGSEILEPYKDNQDAVNYIRDGIEICGIPNGTEQGQVTVAIVGHPPDLEHPVVFELTFALLNGGVRGIAAANDIDLDTNRVRGT